MEVNSLLFALKRPVRLFLSRYSISDKPLVIDSIVTTRPSTPPWPSCADILFNVKERIFTGLCYGIGQEDRPLVREFCSRLPKEIIRYNDLSSEASYKLYSDYGPETHRLEIIWSNVPTDGLEVAQLISGFWYYPKEHSKHIEAVAFGLEDVDEISSDYNLVLPKNLPFPSFIPEPVS